MIKKSEAAAIILVICLMCICLFLPYVYSTKSITMQELLPNVTQVSEAYDLQLQETKWIRRSYGLNEDQYAGAAVYAKEGAMNVEELAIFEAQDQAQLPMIRQACEQRIQNQIKSFTGYGETQVRMLKKAQIKQYGSVIVCVIHDDVEAFLPSLIQGKGEEQ